MSIRRRPNGTYQVRVSTPAGRIEQALPAGATRQDAKALESRLLSQLIDHAIGRKTDPLIQDLVLRWLEGEAKQLRDYRQIVMRCRALTPYFKGRRLSQIVDVTQDFTRDKLAKGRRPATINRHLAMLRRVANLAFSIWNLVDQNWGSKVRLLPENNQRQTFLSESDVQHLAECADSAPVRDAILLASMSGLRRGELLRLRPTSLVDGTLLVQLTKSGHPRLVPLPPPAAEIADRCLPWTITETQLRYGFERARRRAGMTHVRFHDLRHTYASWLLSSGAPLSVVRDLLGHSSIQTTDRYVHAGLAQSRAAVEKLGQNWVRPISKLAGATADISPQSGGPPGSRTPHQRIMRPLK
jgi:integrase